MKSFCRFLHAIEMACEVEYANNQFFRKAVICLQSVALVAVTEAIFFTLLILC